MPTLARFFSTNKSPTKVGALNSVIRIRTLPKAKHPLELGVGLLPFANRVWY